MHQQTSSMYRLNPAPLLGPKTCLLCCEIRAYDSGMSLFVSRATKQLRQQIEQLRADNCQLRAQIEQLRKPLPASEPQAEPFAAIDAVIARQKALSERLRELREQRESWPRGTAGGIARAEEAWRYDDGTFMSYDDEEQIRAEQRERMARGGRARARGARRAADGRFL